MNNSPDSVTTSRQHFREREYAALKSIPGMDKLLSASAGDRLELETKYPDTVFALNILSNPFIPDRELGAIQMEAYSSILKGESISDVHFRYDRNVEVYVTRHNWD